MKNNRSHSSHDARISPPARRSYFPSVASVSKTLRAILLIPLLAAVSANATLWYVDSSATGTHDGKSWATAWSGISSISGVKGGDTVYISGGPSGSSHTYSMSGNWTPAGGSSGSPITYQIGQDSSHNGTAIFSGSGSWFNSGSSSYVIISGDAGDGQMHFATTGFGQIGLLQPGSVNIRISYINFGQIGGGINDGNGASSMGPGFEFDHCYVYISDTTADHFSYMVFNSSAFDQDLFHDNTLYLPRNENGLGADGLQWNGSGFTVYNNHIEGYTANYTGGQHQDGMQPLGGSYIKVYGNTFVNIANYCIFGDGYYSGFAHFWVYNNIIILSDTAMQQSNPPGGIAIGPDGGSLANLGSWPSMTDIVIINNTIDGYVGHGPIGLWNPPPTAAVFSSCVVANNIYVNSGGPALAPAVANINNVSLTAAQGPKNFVSYTVDSENNDYHLIANATTLIGQGANESSYFSTDKDGKLRPAAGAGAWDIGPYQFGSSGGTGPVSLTLLPISVNASDVDANIAGLQVYEGTTVQYSSGSIYNGTNTINWQWTYSVNGGATVVYQSGSGSIPIVSFSYPTGTGGNTYVWTLLATAGTNSASSTFTMSVETPPAPNTSLTFQATSGTITAPFTVTGNYISQSVTSTTISATGEAVYNFVITNAGNYVIQALVNAPSDAANSFYVNIDAQPVDPTMAWDIFPFTSGFQNAIVSWRGTGTDTNNQFIPKIFALTTGAHQIIFAGREANTQLQSFSLLQLPATPQNLRVLSTVMGNAPSFSAGP